MKNSLFAGVLNIFPTQRIFKNWREQFYSVLPVNLVSQFFRFMVDFKQQSLAFGILTPIHINNVRQPLERRTVKQGLKWEARRSAHST